MNPGAAYSNRPDFSTAGAPFPYEDLVPLPLREPAAVRLLPDTDSHLGLVYCSILGFRPLRLDIHLPAASAEPVPLVVYVHGGSFIGGVPEMGPWTSLPAHGIAVAALSYRLAGEAPFPAPVDDIRAGLSWLSSHSERWGLDRSRFSLWGSSAGGYLVGIAALSAAADPSVVGSSPITAVICHYPLTTPDRLGEDALSTGRDNARRLLHIADRFCPQKPAVMDFIKTGHTPPPFLIVHGTEDTRVGPEQSMRLHLALLRAKGHSTLRLIPGADHGGPEFFRTEAADEVVSFLNGVWDRQ